jgi:signal transduction histidine kinase
VKLRSQIALFGGGVLGVVLLLVGALLDSPDADGASRLLIPAWVLGLVLFWIVGLGVEGGLRRNVSELARRARIHRADGLSISEETAPELRELESLLGQLHGEMRERIGEIERERGELQTLVDSIAEGVVALTADARILRMNGAAAKLLDLVSPPPLAPIGTLIRNPELRSHLENSVAAALPPREIRIGDRHLLVSAHPMKGGGSVVTLVDVTGLRQLEQVRRDFVANASHELKTPLTAMRGYAETLLEGDPPEELRTRFLQAIRTNTLRLQHLIDDLLDLSRLESGRWVAAEEEVEVASSAREAWKEIVADYPSRRTSFSIAGDALAVADAQALHQIFRNLFDNSLRYTPDEGEIEVDIRRTGPMVQISVRDTGSGIPSAALPRIFERFYRADPGRDRAAGGTGLGLSIVRHLVQSMKGEIRASSELGKGTVIYFTLPGVEEESG